MTTHTATTQPNQPNSPHTWTVAEAKARLSEILRLANEEGPQRIGVQRGFIIVPERVWQERGRPRKHIGRWLVENLPRDAGLEVPSRNEEDDRPIPFTDYDRP